MRRIISILAAIALAGCGSLPRGPAIGPRSGEPRAARLLENRVWIEEAPEAEPGAFRTFLSDGTMIVASCDAPWRLVPWRMVDETTFVWDEGGTAVRAEIAVLGPRELALLIAPEGAALGRSFRAAEPPSGCP
jgi:hypothetical protein